MSYCQVMKTELRVFLFKKLIESQNTAYDYVKNMHHLTEKSKLSIVGFLRLICYDGNTTKMSTNFKVLRRF